MHCIYVCFYIVAIAARVLYMLDKQNAATCISLLTDPNVNTTLSVPILLIDAQSAHTFVRTKLRDSTAIANFSQQMLVRFPHALCFGANPITPTDDNKALQDQ